MFKRKFIQYQLGMLFQVMLLHASLREIPLNVFEKKTLHLWASKSLIIFFHN